ncbi:hypothetical protein P153DRAFT_426291 [Dothidotthia symphoricarpi CBS 119687]|uniref:Uncharacterized protein n=1 Tax=Dothidotthia symphoricarpi CBS 119687 TaxID=1392245 RepID=A0A6A5ZYR9_9PLEO|nr:uncharacterized protein P153DRAFT_426291 [Dothidotthia symphoricarpi CBS 119687]KAF2124730.1 hypothetical protein P153DRAFT_426291 [Dothidotthia symphoricarpi CBS 119687]
MAPVDTAAAALTNALPIALFAGHALLVTGLSANVLRTARRAAKSLPPSTRTRSQSPLRRRNATIFSALAFVSLASVTTFAVIWRAISYIQWAEQGNHETPGSLWTGWYGTGEEGLGRWHLGDWIKDIDLTHELDTVAVLRPEGFLYTSQHFVGLIASAIFMGIEGHRRSLSSSTIASFVILSATGSLGYALSLFFVTILYTPLTVHKSDAPLRDALFTPRPAVYDILIVTSLLSLNAFPGFLKQGGDVRFLRLGYLAIPLLFAYAPKIVPLRLGIQHNTKASAHRSYTKVYHALSIASFLLYWRLVTTNIFANTPPEPSYIWDVFTNAIGKNDASRTNRVLSGLSITGQKLKHISAHPAVSVTSLDVLFTTISLLAWTFTRNLDVDDVLESSVLSFLVPKHEKHVSFENDTTPSQNHESESEAPVKTTPRKGGRSNKSSTTASSPLPSALTSRLRRGTRGQGRNADYGSDNDSTYQPSPATKRDVAEMETDGASTTGDLVHAGESTALTLFLAFLGGLGQLAAGALGAEVAGPRE